MKHMGPIMAGLLAAALSTATAHAGVSCVVDKGDVVATFPEGYAFATALSDGSSLVMKEMAVASGVMQQSGEENSTLPGEWAIIVDENHRLAPFKPGVKTLRLPIKTQQGIHYRNAKAVNVKAFPKTGTYTILFSNNLETELENMLLDSCEVRIP